MEFKVGNTYHANIGPWPEKPYKIHILAIVDEHMIVYKWYDRYGQRWHYEVRYQDFLERDIEGVRT